MDAGVPMKSAVAGIAMGLIKEGDEVRVLTDILGLEDHLGDMDFKICGTREGITAFQMDMKVTGLSSDIMRQALDQARRARLTVLDKMDACLAASRDELSPHAPRIVSIKIDVEKIRDVIGPGGKIVREIQAKTGAEINIEDDGTINVASADGESVEKAIAMIEQITADVELGEVYHGTVARVMSFGAFVSILGKKEGLVRMPDLALEYIDRVEDVVDVGDEIDVKVIEIDSMGRINLSKVEADFELGRINQDEYDAFKKKARGGDRPRRSSGGHDRHGGGGSRDRRGGGSRDRRPGGGHDRDRGGRSRR